MPTYAATGLTASLATCDLESTLTNGVDLQQGSKWRTTSSRVHDVLSSATKLRERPIGEDGLEKGVVRFVGVNADMPLYMVEAGETVRRRSQMEPAQDVEMSDGVVDAMIDPLLSSDDSPLTSLGATPTSPTHQIFPPTSDKMAKVNSLEKAIRSVVLTPNHAINRSAAAAQALVLDVDLSRQSHLPPTDSKRSGKDLKIEVFINGQLVDVSFVNARRSAVQINDDRARFAGTRVHRQVEKPWIYVPAADDTLDEDPQPDYGGDSERRWDAVATALIKEAELRGKDSFGVMPPSAEFLTAMAGLGLPRRLEEQRKIGIIDVVITAGTGKKHGPETAYLLQPARMDDPEFFQESSSFGDLKLEESPSTVNFATLPQTSSPEIPLQLHRQQTAEASPTPKRTQDLSKDFKLHISKDVKKTLLGAFEASKGVIGSGNRTLGQRLGDLKKMKPVNQERELERLKNEFGLKDDGDSEEERRPKKRKMDEAVTVPQQDQGLQALPGNSIAEDETDSATPMEAPYWISRDDTIDPQKLFHNTPVLPPAPQMPDGANPDALLTQKRIDMALSEGAASNGRLLSKIASQSPQRTPQKRTRASALAGSPAHVPVKSLQRRQKEPQSTPQGRRVTSSPLCGSRSATKAATLVDATPTRSGRGSNRTARKWDPQEVSPTEALKAFEVPHECKDSCVRHVEGEVMQRQIGKARGGMFKEGEVLVGVRFVVLP